MVRLNHLNRLFGSAFSCFQSGSVGPWYASEPLGRRVHAGVSSSRGMLAVADADSLLSVVARLA